jgi:phage repressor protein C with HTH and peptisase S24 domain
MLDGAQLPSLQMSRYIVNTVVKYGLLMLSSELRVQVPYMKPNERLVRARLKAKFESARAAALSHGWPESTYRAHETGLRNFSLQDAEKYGRAFGTNGRWIFYGEGEMEDKASTYQYAPVQNVLPNAGIRRNSDRLSGRRIPVLGQAVGGDRGDFIMNGQVVEDVMCPPGLENVPGAYALFVLGDSMEPRYRAGEVVYIHPGKPCRRGDYVVVQVRGVDNEHPQGFIKRFEALTPTWLSLSQLNPPEDLGFPRSEVISVHRIVFSGEA